ncbi:MAG: AAA family ATPase [Sulfolobales archaeon]
MARQYAIQAVRYDKEGKFDDAIKNYKKAVEVLRRIVSLYPDGGLNNIYRQWVKEYEKRIKDLESMKLATTSQNYMQSSSDDVLNEVIFKEKPGVTFNDIADLVDVKEAVKEAIIYPTLRPELFPLGWHRGILLFGPPGCGKTLLAAAVATEIDGIFIHLDAASIMSKWLGEAEKNVAKIFKKARELSQNGKPVIIFIDEVDSLLGMYNSEVGGEVRVRNQFLKEMDGLLDKSFKYFIYVIAATNKPWRLDEAFIRRFQKRIFIPLPNKEARVELLKLYTKGLKLSEDVDLEKLSEILDGYTSSDIRDIIMAAHLRTVKELFEKQGGSGNPREITLGDFTDVIKSRKPSVSREAIKVYESWYEKFKAV